MSNDISSRKLELQLWEQIKADLEECASLGYVPSRFKKMVAELGPVETFRRLIGAERPSDGFLRLFELQRLHITAEARVLHGPWRVLFSEHVLALAKKRLTAYGRPDLAIVA